MVRANRLRQDERNTREGGETQDAIEALSDTHRSGLPEMPMMATARSFWNLGTKGHESPLSRA